MSMTQTPIHDEVQFERPMVHIFSDRCAGCQECVVRCPTSALSMDPQHWIAVADNSLCVGCRQCVRTCPFSAISVEGPLMVAARVNSEVHLKADVLGDNEEVHTGFRSLADAASEAERCLACPDPTCVRGCPAHNDIPGFIKAVRDGDLGRAKEVLSLTSCLPSTCSRVCDWDSQCEGSCTWTLAGGEAVAIGRIERFIAEHSEAPLVHQGVSKDIKVAVIGAGPGGMGAAYELVRGGSSVEVFESESEPGGVMRWGIPGYVLPDTAWMSTVDELEAAGVKFTYDHKIAPQDVGTLLETFDGVVLSAGAEQPIVPKLEGVELLGVVDAAHLLEGAKEVLSSQDVPALYDGKKVLVLGAGNTAMDVARSVLRLGGKPIAIDWMDERFARARPDEIAEARAEGVDVRFLTTVTKLIGDDEGKVVMAELSHTSQASRTAMPQILNQAPVTIEVDMVVLAMGYRVEQEWKGTSKIVQFGVMSQAEGLLDRRWIGSGMFATGSPVAQLAYDREIARKESAFAVAERIWAVGDVKVGPSTVVSSMAQGMSAARGMLTELGHHSGAHVEHNSDRDSSAVIVYESLGGNTHKAANVIAGVLWNRGWNAKVVQASQLQHQDLLDAELVVFGTWVEGLVLTKVHPSKKAMDEIRKLPPLYEKRVATFVTYGFDPKGAATELAEGFRLKGADVVQEGAFHHGKISREAKQFAWALADTASLVLQ